jgi:prepilin-type processing-associated H-X9-DG protein
MGRMLDADFDHDGLPDLAIAVNRGQPLLLRNETVTSHHSLKVRFIGPSAACFGARLEVTVGDSRQTRWWGGDVSFPSTHAPEAIFGLGAATHADQLQVTWADGHVTTLAHVAAGIIRVVHPHYASP